MITSFKLTLGTPQPQCIRPDLGYALYGFLCESAGEPFGDLVHEQAVSPVRQSIRPAATGQAVWGIDVFGDAAAAALVPFLTGLREVRLDRLADAMPVLHCEAAGTLSAADVLHLSQQEPAARRVRFAFPAPTGFKTAGGYALYPTAELIVKSLYQRWNALTDGFSLEDDDALAMLLQGLRLTHYELCSTAFPLKGRWISAFRGSVVLQSSLPAPLEEIWRLLAVFARFSGVGIKTALGMGEAETCFLPERAQDGHR